jgi:release factor glutamine methyltransferase
LIAPAVSSAGPARSVGEWLSWATDEIGAADAGARMEARTDAIALLEAIAGVGPASVYAHPERVLPAVAAEAFARAVARRAAGEPVAYIVGSRGFHALELEVSPHVLIPRPETEILVDAVLERAPRDAAFTVLDLGTGSGAIALAIAHARPAARVCAVDASAEALATARGNGRRLGIAVEWIESDWYESLAGRRFDFIVSNPPYVRSDDPHMAQLVNEPRLALDGGPDGLESLRRVLAGAVSHLAAHGTVLVEHGFDQAADVAAIARTHSLAVRTTIVDGGGHVRCTVLQAGP